MRFDVYLHTVDSDSCIRADLARIIDLLHVVIRKEVSMTTKLEELEVQVAANTDAEASAVLLLTKLHELLVAAGSDPVKLAKLTSDLAASKEALAAAIVANTPAEEPPVEVPPAP